MYPSVSVVVGRLNEGQKICVVYCSVYWFLAQVLWRSVQKSRKPIGLVLMSQEMVAGLGNIYRWVEQAARQVFVMSEVGRQPGSQAAGSSWLYGFEARNKATNSAID